MRDDQLTLLEAEAQTDPAELFLPLEFWLPDCEAQSIMELLPWQRFQLAWWGRCNVFDWKVRALADA